MKRTLCVAALTAIIISAMAGSAYAAGINHSGQDRLGAAHVTVSGGVVSGPGEGPVILGQQSGTFTYEQWDPSKGSNATNGNSPHGDYTTTTVKCVVCHAVHYAAPGGATVASGNQTADTLLRMRADQACVFCHATAGYAVNGTPVYDGLGEAIVGPGNTGAATNTGHITGTNCTFCHTNVHGAGADHSVASLDGFLLKLMSAPNVQNTGSDTNNMIEAITVIDHNAVNQGFNAGDALAGTIAQYATVNSSTLREQAVGIFCAECHNGAYATAAPGAATNVYGSDTASYSGHRIAAAATSTWNATGNISSGAVSNATVAWADATNCKSCHDANDVFGNKAFPHSWGGTKMWLTAKADAGAPIEDLPYGTAPNSAYNTGEPQLSDGVCLKCHIAPGGASGVGITF